MLEANDRYVFPAFPNQLIGANSSHAAVLDLMQSVNAQNIRVLILFMRWYDVRTVLRAAFELGMYGDGYVYVLSDSTSGVDPLEVFNDDQLLAAANGALVVQIGTLATDLNDFESQRFRIAFQRTYGMQPGLASAYAYDAVWSVALGIAKVQAQQCVVAHGPALSDAILSVNFSGATGSVRYSGNALSTSSYLLQNFVGLEYRTVGTLLGSGAGGTAGSLVLSKNGPGIVWPGFGSAAPGLDAYEIGVMTFKGFPRGLYAVSGVQMALQDLMLDDGGLLRGDTLLMPQWNVLDDGCTPESARSTFMRFVTGTRATMDGPRSKPIALIGPLCSGSAKGYLPLASGYTLPTVSFDATDMALNNRTAYPYFARMRPSNAGEIDAILTVLLYFGWQRVALLGTGDDFSVSGVSRMRILASAMGVDLYPVQSWPAFSSADVVRERLAPAVNDGVKVFVTYVGVCRTLLVFDVLCSQA